MDFVSKWEKLYTPYAFILVGGWVPLNPLWIHWYFFVSFFGFSLSGQEAMASCPPRVNQRIATVSSSRFVFSEAPSSKRHPPLWSISSTSAILFPLFSIVWNVCHQAVMYVWHCMIGKIMRSKLLGSEVRWGAPPQLLTRSVPGVLQVSMIHSHELAMYSYLPHWQ